MQPIVGRKVIEDLEQGLIASDDPFFLDAEKMHILDESGSLVKELDKNDFIRCVVMLRAKLYNGPQVMAIGDTISIKGGELASQPWAARHDVKYGDLPTRSIVIVEVGRCEEGLPEFIFMMYYKETPKISVL